LFSVFHYHSSINLPVNVTRLEISKISSNFATKKILMYHYKILLNREREGGFTVNVPSLPGCITYGEDLDEAISMAKEAIELYLEELRARGEIINDDSETIEYSVNLQAV
jgi:predicted RNase H-like HicB family nuclease